ncbi:MAG: hypothetical protein WC763_06785 [Candidatus Paceibacterota bacterium]
MPMPGEEEEKKKKALPKPHSNERGAPPAKRVKKAAASTAASSSSSTKATVKHRPLPSGLLIRASGQPAYEFVRINNRANKLLDAECLCTLPVRSELMEANWIAWADDDGMQKNLPMNCLINPIMEDHDVIYMARLGGPYGDVLLEGGRALKWDLLAAVFTKCDASLAEDDGDGDNEEDTFIYRLLQARKKWDGMKEGDDRVEGEETEPKKGISAISP